MIGNEMLVNVVGGLMGSAAFTAAFVSWLFTLGRHDGERVNAVFTYGASLVMALSSSILRSDWWILVFSALMLPVLIALQTAICRVGTRQARGTRGRWGEKWI